MATIVDVARRAGVSITTVSRVINNIDLVNGQTKKKVMRAIKELNYAPSSVAQWMRGHRTESIGVLIPDFTNYYYSTFLNHIELAARARGYLLIVCTTSTDFNREQEYIKDLIRRQVDGLILCWYRGVSDYSQYLKKVAHRVAVVIVDQNTEDLRISSVHTDGYAGIFRLTDALIQAGHRKIAIIKSLKQYPAVNSRFDGYAAALKNNDLDLQEELIEECDFSVEGGYEATARLLRRADPSAIVTIDDLMAIGAIRYCHEKKIKVPEEIAITGFDDIPLAQLITPTLTTVAQPVKDIAETVTNHLIDMVENRKIRYRNFIFEPTVVVRESANICIAGGVEQSS